MFGQADFHKSNFVYSNLIVPIDPNDILGVCSISLTQLRCVPGLFSCGFFFSKGAFYNRLNAEFSRWLQVAAILQTGRFLTLFL